MVVEPATKYAIAFFDGQNLFHAARRAFGYPYPNYDPLALATTICRRAGWTLKRTCFYTGIPDPADDPFWNAVCCILVAEASVTDHPTPSELFFRAMQQVARASRQFRKKGVGESSIQAIEAIRQKQEEHEERALRRNL